MPVPYVPPDLPSGSRTLAPRVLDGVVLRAPHKDARNGIRRLEPLGQLAAVPEPALLGGVCAQRRAAVVDVGDPDVAVQVELEVVAALVGEDLGRAAGEVFPGEALERVDAALGAGLVVEEPDVWRG